MNTKETGERQTHLKNAILYLIIWAAIFAIEATMYKRAGSFEQILMDTDERLVFLLVFSLSVFILALAIRSFFLHLKRVK